MSHDPLIAAARRHARLLQRADGRPYQTHLDEVARSTGAEDWAAFTADPKALPALNADEPDQKKPDTPILIMLLVGFAGMIAVLYANIWPVEHGDMILWTMAAGLAVSLAMVIPMAWRLNRDETRSRRDAKSGPDIADRISRTRSAMAFLSIGALVSIGLSLGMLAIRNSVPNEIIADVAAERTSHVAIRIPGAQEPYRLIDVRREGNVARMRAVAEDGRLGWITARHNMKLDDRLGGEAVTRSYIHHPVIRAIADVRCDTGVWRMVGIETSDAYDGPIAHSHRIAPVGEWKRRPLPERTRSVVCSFRREERI